ncbi:metal ABC transporter solute-binding protein, Zn/Mn family [Microbulbifer sp. 2201CG32-9]|uniref:metal ABC transporter solute-binding protein, Zn/Mn family n=1 Tax=Microbulbifer sp. 2201CG32-9 TaxID=3232309 RepID=UPI00345C4CA3
MMVVMRLLFLFVLAAVAACSKEAPPAATEIVVSMRPLALIAREIVGPDIPVRTLMTGDDPHRYAPSASQRATLENARLVVWMGPELEGVLARQLASLPRQRQLALLDAGGYETAGASAGDPHLWLRPLNAAVIGAHIADRLGELDPAGVEGYRQRARDFSRRMANAQKVLNRALWAYREVPIVVTHDAYGHFFGPAGVRTRALSDSSHTKRGARTLLELQGLGDGCLFGKAPANDRDRQTAASLGLRYGALDLLGSDLPREADYGALVRQLLTDARGCLAETSAQR